MIEGGRKACPEPVEGTEKMKLFSKRNSRGITLIELMVALVIGAVLMTGLFTAFISQHRSYTVQDQISTIQQSVRAGMNLMVREIRMAGFNPILCPCSWSSAGTWFGILTAGEDSIKISADNGVPGAEENGSLDPGETITYSLGNCDANDNCDLLRGDQLVIENVVNKHANINKPLFTYQILADGRKDDIGGLAAMEKDGVDNDGVGGIDQPGEMIIVPNDESTPGPDFAGGPDDYYTSKLSSIDINGDGATNNDADKQFFRDAIRDVIITLVVRTEMEDPNYPGGLNIQGTQDDGTCRTRTLKTRLRLRNQGLGLVPGSGDFNL